MRAGLNSLRYTVMWFLGPVTLGFVSMGAVNKATSNLLPYVRGCKVDIPHCALQPALGGHRPHQSASRGAAPRSAILPRTRRCYGPRSWHSHLRSLATAILWYSKLRFVGPMSHCSIKPAHGSTPALAFGFSAVTVHISTRDAGTTATRSAIPVRHKPVSAHGSRRPQKLTNSRSSV